MSDKKREGGKLCSFACSLFSSLLFQPFFIWLNNEIHRNEVCSINRELNARTCTMHNPKSNSGTFFILFRKKGIKNQECTKWRIEMEHNCSESSRSNIHHSHLKFRVNMRTPQTRSASIPAKSINRISGTKYSTKRKRSASTFYILVQFFYWLWILDYWHLSALWVGFFSFSFPPFSCCCLFIHFPFFYLMVNFWIQNSMMFVYSFPVPVSSLKVWNV